MEDSRRAAGRVKNFSRVIILEKLADLKNPSLQEQIALDLKAGIRVFLCPWDKINNKVAEPDFGIWDNNYVCIVPFNKQRVVSEIELNNNPEALKLAKTWQREILKTATEIHRPQDIKKFARANR